VKRPPIQARPVQPHPIHPYSQSGGALTTRSRRCACGGNTRCGGSRGLAHTGKPPETHRLPLGPSYRGCLCLREGHRPRHPNPHDALHTAMRAKTPSRRVARAAVDATPLEPRAPGPGQGSPYARTRGSGQATAVPEQSSGDLVKVGARMKGRKTIGSFRLVDPTGSPMPIEFQPLRERFT